MNIKKKFYTILVLFTFFVSGLLATEAHAVDQDITDRYPSAFARPDLLSVSEAEYLMPYAPELDVDVYLSLQQGYDNNVELDSRRRKDGFLQSSLSADLSYDVDESLSLKGGADLFTMFFYNHNRNNIMNIAPYAGFDWEIIPDLVSMSRITYDGFIYPNDHENTYHGLVLGQFLRHYLFDGFYHEIGYEYLHRWYPHRDRTLAGLTTDGKMRQDSRNRVEYNAVWRTGDLVLGLSNQFSFNDSNEKFQDYYDWWMYRLSPTVMYFFTDSLYASGSLVYRHTAYDERRVTEDPGKKVKENSYLFIASVFYDITAKTTLGVTYSYTEAASNEPIQRYSGSTVTGGVYYKF